MSLETLENLFDLVLRPDGTASTKEKTDNADRLPQKLLEYEGSVHQAIRNFQGVLLFHTEGPQKALGCFRQVLQTDEDNLNALQNCKYLFNKLKNDSEVNRCKTNIDKLLDNDNPSKPLLLARFYAELGFAMSFEFNFDRGTDVHDCERFEKATAFCEKALTNPAIFPVEESCQWHFFGGRAYHRLYDRSLKKQPHAKATTQHITLKRCIGLFCYVLKNTDIATYKSRAWCLLGTVLFKMPHGHRKQIESFITNCKLTRELRNPSLCFQKARHLCPDNAKLVCRHARMFANQKFQDFSRAVRIVDQSIAMDSSNMNWLAHSFRAEIRKGMYCELEKRYIAAKPINQQASPPSRELLELAKQDFERSLELKPIVSELIGLAEVCYLLGKRRDNHELDKHLIEEALCHFSQAVDSLEGRRHPQLHLKRGRCLKDFGESRGAIESYKTALECDITAAYPYPRAFKELIQLMLSKYRMGNMLVSETAFWFDYGFRKYGANIEFYVKNICHSQSAPEMFDVCMELIVKRNYASAKFALSRLIEGLAQILTVHEYRTSGMINVAAVEKDLQIAEREYKTLMTTSERQDIDAQISGMAIVSSADVKVHPSPEKALNDKNKRYDFCVLYDEKDRDWVCYSLVPKLEDWYKFKGFIPDRDISYGQETTDELGQATEDSICTIAVLTPEFVSNKLLHKMLLCAFQEDDHHILFLRLKECDTPSKLRKLSQSPVIEFPDWHALTTKLGELIKE